MSKSKDNELREKLDAEQYRVTQNAGTEPAYTGKYVDHKSDGTYRCVCCDAELFSSEHKYDSGSGWPSFWLPLAGDTVRTRTDESRGMVRSEVVCKNCDAHLGHVFEDGPQPTGLLTDLGPQLARGEGEVMFRDELAPFHRWHGLHYRIGHLLIVNLLHEPLAYP